MKIKVTKTETIEQEVELSFPCYFKAGVAERETSFFKLLDETIGLHVWTPDILPSNAAIGYARNIGDVIINGTPITKEEFDAAYARTLTHITNDFNK